MLNQFTAVIGEKNINISDMTNKSRGEVAYTMLDIESAATQDLVEALQKIDGVFRVRVVNRISNKTCRKVTDRHWVEYIRCLFYFSQKRCML